MFDGDNKVPVLYDYCPFEDVSLGLVILSDLYVHYCHGHLLEVGGVNDQPSWYIDAMLSIETHLSRLKADSSEKALKKMQK